MKRILLLFTILLLAVNSFSQLVNIEEKRKAKKEGIQGDISFSIDLKENTKQIFQFKNSIGVQYVKSPHTILLFNDLSFIQVDNEPALVNSGFQHIRYNYTFQDSSFITWELFAQHQYNSIKLLKRRFISGTGPRFRVIKNKNFRLFIAPLSMYEYELLTDDSTETHKIKADYYTSLFININDIFSISNTTYYQPDYSYWKDFRISSETSLNLQFTEKLSFSIIYDLAYDSDPPVDYTLDEPAPIPKLFYSLRNALVYSF